MTAMRITKRIVDPITFEEFVGVEFLPRLEDTVLDDQLGDSMCFAAPTKPIQHLPPPPPPPPSEPPSPTKFRPPTPPKARGTGADDPNAPRPEIVSPLLRRSSLLSPKGRQRAVLALTGSSPTKSPRKSLLSPNNGQQRGSLIITQSPGRLSKQLTEIGEDHELELDLEASLSNLSDQLQTSLSKISKPIEKKLRFADEVDLKEFSRAHLSMMDDLFYASDELANFRYEAFMEEAGLDINDFD